MSTYNHSFRNRLLTYFQQKLAMEDYHGGWLRGDCPECGKRKKFGIHLGYNRSNCFSCHYNKKPLWIVGELEKLSTLNEIKNYLGAFKETEYLEPEIELMHQKKVALPESFRLIMIGTSSVSLKAQSYMKGRGFDLMELMLKGVGYCTTGTYNFRIIFPFYQRGRLIYFIARQFIGAGPKFQNPSVEEFGIGKSMLIYNVDALAVYKRIYLVESVTNALTLGDRAIAIMGKILSGYQKSLILSSGVTEVIIILDDDAWSYAVAAALELSPHLPVKIVMMPKGKDVNALGRKETIRIIRKTPWLKYPQVLSHHLRLKTI